MIFDGTVQDIINLSLYDSDGGKVDLRKCSNIQVKLPIKDSEFDLLRYNQIKSLYKVDVLNENDEFFNDICINYIGKNETDSTINTRRKEFNKNILCGKNCKYKETDNNGYSICDCNFNINIASTNKESNNSIKEMSRDNSFLKIDTGGGNSHSINEGRDQLATDPTDQSNNELLPESNNDENLDEQHINNDNTNQLPYDSLNSEELNQAEITNKISISKFKFNVFSNIVIFTCYYRAFEQIGKNKAFWLFISLIITTIIISIMITWIITPEILINNYLDEVINNEFQEDLLDDEAYALRKLKSIKVEDKSNWLLKTFSFKKKLYCRYFINKLTSRKIFIKRKHIDSKLNSKKPSGILSNFKDELKKPIANYQSNRSTTSNMNLFNTKSKNFENILKINSSIKKGYLKITNNVYFVNYY